MKKWLDKYQNKGEVNIPFIPRNELFQWNNRPIIENTAAPIYIPSGVYGPAHVVNGPSRGLTKGEEKAIYKNLKNNIAAEKQQEIENYKAAKLFHENNPVAILLGTRKPKPTSVKPTAREIAYGAGAGINEFYDVPGIGILNDFNPLSLVSKGIISPWLQAPLQAQQSDSYLPYAGAALSTALTVPILRSAATFAKTILNPANIYRGALGAGEYLTTQTPLKNTYKINPLALKENPEMFLYRARPVGQDVNMNMAAQLRAKQAAGEPLTWYQKNLLNPQTNPQLLAREKYYGQWFEKDPSRLDWYIDPGTRNFADKDAIEILRTRLPKSEADKLNVSQFPDAKVLSASPETEFILPKNMISSAERFPESSWQELIQQDKAFNTPHWLKGYGKKSNLKVFTEGQPYENIAPVKWSMQELPGLHLKSTMSDGAISKIVEPKTGLINVEQALGIIGKESGGAEKLAIVKQGLGENLPKKMDYNEFRKVVQDQLIPLERQFVTHSSNYGINRLGYLGPKASSYDISIQTTKDAIARGENVAENQIHLEKLLNEYKQLPLENQTLILGNKNKFGKGSNAHGNPDETLGHVHFLRDAESPDVLTVTQIQSDAFQGTHRIMPKNAPDVSKAQYSLQRMEELQNRNKSILNKMKTEGVDEAGVPVQDYQIKQFEDIVKAQEQSNLFKKAEIENFTQKQLLDKNHQERYLQELVNYAGERGDINKLRLPTSETAAKVQGYRPATTAEEAIKEYNKLKGTSEWDEIMSNTSDADKVRLEKVLKGEIKGDIYSLENETILKKYSEQPKTIKKLFGVEPKVVTDSKGNTWYEFDIPENFKGNKGEIKAFKNGGPIVTSRGQLDKYQNGREVLFNKPSVPRSDNTYVKIPYIPKKGKPKTLPSGLPIPTYIPPAPIIRADVRDDYEKAISKQIAEEYERKKRLENTDLAKTFASFTPGNNIEAGVSGAETFVNMNPVLTGPIMSTSRLANAISHPTNNQYWSGDKSKVENALGVLGAIGDVAMISPYFKGAGKFITTQTPLKNTWKLNPLVWKPNPEAYYHRSPNIENIVNQETGMLQGFGESEAGRAYSKSVAPGTGNELTSDGRVSRIQLKKAANSEMYFSKGTPLDWGRTNMVLDKQTGKLVPGHGYPGPYIAEVTDVPFVGKANGKFTKIFDPETGEYVKGKLPPVGKGSYAVPKRLVSLDETKFYKEDWLRGYKQIKVPSIERSVVKQLPSFGNVDNVVPSEKIDSKVLKNISGLTKEELLQKDLGKYKDVVSKMSATDFRNTVLKPNGEITTYKPITEVEQMIYDLGNRRLKLKDAIEMSDKEYVDAFNERLDLLNDIIAQRNKSGIEYRVKGLDESGKLTFYTPQQSIRRGDVDIPISARESTWGVRLNPGQWKGNVEDIASTEYFRSIPGLEMHDSRAGVFADIFLTGTPGTKAYESVNEYLKRLNLGRVKTGFSSQTETLRNDSGKILTTGAKDVWEHFIKSGKGVGFYGNPRIVYGVMKQQGGPIVTNRGQWDYPGQTTIIPSNKITMTGVDYPVLGVDNTGYTKMMQPGMDYTFPGQYVTEYPMAQNGYQVPKADDTYVRLPYVTIPPKGGFKYRDFPKETLAIRQKAYDTIEPSSYLDIDNYTRWKTGEKRNSFSDPRSEEAWKFYLGLTNPDETSYIKKSKYRPTINAVKPYYYSVDPSLEKDIFNAYKDKVQLNKTLQTDEFELETPLSGENAAAMLGRFGVSKGHDEKGDYLSYYDKYDLKDFAQTRTKGLPYSIYGRIYYPKKEQGGEMISDYKSGGQHGGGWRKAEYGMEVMSDGGVPNNPGFNSLPEYVQQNIINNMATGGQKMPPQLAYARFAAAGNLNQLNRYGYQHGGSIPTIEGPSGYMNEDNVWVVDNKTIKKQAKELGAKKVLTEGGSLIIFDDNWNIVAVDDNPSASYKQGGVVLNTGGEKHRIYVKSTNRGEGAKGHIMVNHPTMDKGIWDTIDLTEKAGATTIAQGVAATKKWHRENPYKKQDGGEEYTYWRTGKPMVNDPSMDAISKVLLQRNLDKNFMQRAAGFGYQGGIPTRYIPDQDPNSDAVSTLLMSFGDNRVFPTIIQTGPSQLSYQPDQTQEYLEAPSWDVADYFSTKGYKRAANDMYGMEYQNGGVVKFNPLLINKKIWSEPNYVVGPNAEGHYGYNGYDTINYNPNDEIENINNPWWLGHEKYHHYQTLSGNNPKGKRQKELNDKINQMIKKSPTLQFVPEEILIRGIHQDNHHIPGAEDLIYEDPNTLEGAARLYENYIREGGDPIFANGGYVVRRSHDRKGKTHVVIGPDGTKKYFGDSKMGQHPNDPARKKAFYARHKHNLAHNPYFRAFARATWEEGGETYAIGGQSTLNPIVKKDNRNWLDFLKN